MAIPPALGSALQDLVQGLSARMLEVEQSFAASYSPPLVPQEVAVLRLMLRAERLRMSDVGKQLALPLSSATYLMDKLERRGLASRLRIPGDRRAVHVELTDEGRDAAIRLRQAQVALCDELIAGFGEAEQQVLRRILARLEGGAD